MLPAELREKKKQEQKQKLLKQSAEAKNILTGVCAIPDGIKLLRLLMEECGYQKVSIVGDPATGDIHSRATIYNEARRNLYLTLRVNIPIKYRRVIENSITKK